MVPALLITGSKYSFIRHKLRFFAYFCLAEPASRTFFNSLINSDLLVATLVTTINIRRFYLLLGPLISLVIFADRFVSTALAINLLPIQLKDLQASDSAPHDDYGILVALSIDTAVIGVLLTTPAALILAPHTFTRAATARGPCNKSSLPAIVLPGINSVGRLPCRAIPS